MNRVLYTAILLLIYSCTQPIPTESEQIVAYYEGFQDSDFDQIRTVIADSITLVEASYIMPYSKKSFYDHFQWDSVFAPVYRVVDIERVDDHYVAEIAVSSSRFKFLKNDPLVSRQRFYFDYNKISIVENVEFIGTDWGKWSAQRDSLVKWTATNHQELNGFINDLTKQGAINYKKAIELYEESQSITDE